MVKQERSGEKHKMRPGGEVETRDREMIKDLQKILAVLCGQRGRRVIGLFTKDPTALLQSVSTTQEAGEVRREVRFANSYPEYSLRKQPRRSNRLHGTWHSRETTEIYDEHGNRIGFMTKYDYRPRRNGGREQGPKLGLREYAYYPVRFNEHSLCVIYEKRPKKESRRNGEGLSVEQQPNLQIAPPLSLMTASANPNYDAAGPFATAAATTEGRDLADDASTDAFGSLDFSDEGWNDSHYGAI